VKFIFLEKHHVYTVTEYVTLDNGKLEGKCLKRYMFFWREYTWWW